MPATKADSVNLIIRLKTILALFAQVARLRVASVLLSPVIVIAIDMLPAVMPYGIRARNTECSLGADASINRFPTVPI